MKDRRRAFVLLDERIAKMHGILFREIGDFLCSADDPGDNVNVFRIFDDCVRAVFAGIIHVFDVTISGSGERDPVRCVDNRSKRGKMIHGLALRGDDRASDFFERMDAGVERENRNNETIPD